ncbi:MAG: hypothetical protein AAGU19_03795 [Prolixibacteraceae bacterium]
MVKIVQFCALMITVSMFQAIMSEASDLHHHTPNKTELNTHDRTADLHSIKPAGFDLSEMACCLNPDLNNIPSIKSILRFTGSWPKHGPVNGQLHVHEPLIFADHSSDPTGYYVFGLRKIIT